MEKVTQECADPKSALWSQKLKECLNVEPGSRETADEKIYFGTSDEQAAVLKVILDLVSKLPLKFNELRKCRSIRSFLLRQHLGIGHAFGCHVRCGRQPPGCRFRGTLCRFSSTSDCEHPGEGVPLPSVAGLAPGWTYGCFLAITRSCARACPSGHLPPHCRRRSSR